MLIQDFQHSFGPFFASRDVDFVDLLAELQRGHGARVSQAEGHPEHVHLADGLNRHSLAIVSYSWKVR